MPKPRWMPLPQLLYAQVIKTVRGERLIRGHHRARLADQHGMHGSETEATGAPPLPRWGRAVRPFPIPVVADLLYPGKGKCKLPK
jgi:hypothetical protein